MPDWKVEIRERLTGLSTDRRRFDTIVEELAEHLDDRYAELREEGMPEAAARRGALDELAGRDVLRRALERVEPRRSMMERDPGRDAGGWFSGITTDIRDGLRSLRGSRALTIVALLTLTIGIGSNVAIFSVVNAAMFRPLPFDTPERLVTFWGTAPQMGLPVVSTPDALVVYYRERTKTLAPLAAYSTQGFSLAGAAEAERVDGAYVTPDFFRVLGREPALGRGFVADEEIRGRNHVVILSDGLWRRRFGGATDIVGRSTQIDGRSMAIVGVMPPDFDFPGRAELWAPLPIDRNSLNCWCYDTVARLTPGQTPHTAAREIARLTDEFWAEREGRPRLPPGEEPKTAIIAQTLSRHLVGDLHTPLLLLLASVSVVLLVVCANIANLLLSRAIAHRREIAVRCCLGASPWRIVRQLLVESALLGAAGTALGLGLAMWASHFLGRIVADRLPHVHDVAVDLRVVLFSCGVAAFAVMLFGVAPALRGAGVQLREAVGAGARTTGGRSHRRLGDAFVIAQFALSVVLLIGAGLLTRSLGNLLAVDPGFRPDNVLVGALDFETGSPERDREIARVFFSQVEDRIRSLPGVVDVGLSSIAPFSRANNQQIFTIKGREPARGQPQLVASNRTVTPGYFSAVGTRLLRGRAFSENDRAGAPLVAIVDETLARRFWPDGNAVGHEVRLDDNGPWRTIVGVVASIKHGDLSADSDRYVYVPYAQNPIQWMEVVVRTATEPAALTPAIRHEIAVINRSVPFHDVHTLEAAVARSMQTQRLTNELLIAFAIAALLLAAVGTYGVMALNVSQRTGEFGVRLALGATRSQVLQLVLSRGLRLALVGLMIGLVLAVAVTRYLGTLLFHVKPIDPFVFSLVSIVLAAAAVMACFIPAVRATAIEPLDALRYQ